MKEKPSTAPDKLQDEVGERDVKFGDVASASVAAQLSSLEMNLHTVSTTSRTKDYTSFAMGKTKLQGI